MTSQAVLAALQEQQAKPSQVPVVESWTRWIYYRVHKHLKVCYVEKGVGEIPPAAPFNHRGEAFATESVRFDGFVPVVN